MNGHRGCNKFGIVQRACKHLVYHNYFMRIKYIMQCDVLKINLPSWDVILLNKKMVVRSYYKFVKNRLCQHMQPVAILF